MANIRIERLNDSIQEELSKILLLEAKDQNFKSITITGCETSKDLSFCKVFFTVFDENKKVDIGNALNEAASFLRGELSKKIEIRHTPELKFIYDESIQYGNRIEKIIKEIHNDKGV